MSSIKPRKPISQSLFRHQPSLIPSNPDAPPPDISLLEYQLPKWCQTALMVQAPSLKSPSRHGTSSQNTSSGTHNKSRIHACRALLKVAEERHDLRKAMVLSRGLIETCVLVLHEEEDDKNALALRRCQQLLLDLLCHLLLTQPLLDQYIVHEDQMTDAMAKMLLASDRELQESVAIVFDYFCVCEENRSHVCHTDHMLFGVVQLLHNTKSVDAREHVLQGLLYLSEHPADNRFLIPRQPGMLEALTLCLFYLQISIPTKTLQILHNILLIKENIPLVARHKELRERIQVTMNNAKRVLLKNGQIESLSAEDEELLHGLPRQDDAEHDESPPFHAPPPHYDNLVPSGPRARQEMMNGSQSSDPYRFEKEIVRISTIILQLLFRYDTRLNSKVILDESDFSSMRRIVVPHSEGDFVSSSMVGTGSDSESIRTQNNSLQMSVDERIHARRNNVRRLALQRKEEQLKLRS